MFDWLAAIIAPHRCICCGVVGALLCAGCTASLPAAIGRCFGCHRLSPDGKTCRSCRRRYALFSVRAATRYEGAAKQLIWRLKFERAYAGAGPAALVMAARLPLDSDVIIVHVPTAARRVRQRGYDQAQVLASKLAAYTDRPLIRGLMRIGRQQQRGVARRQRLEQLRNAFVVPRPGSVRGAHIILVDDVVTTGATLNAAAVALRAAGARRVSAVVFAQA